MLYSALSIIMTQRCNAACEICCEECSPQKSATLTAGEIHTAIRQAAETDGIREICFTGGEPFLVPELLFEGLECAAGYGLKTSVYTNGFWGADESRARTWAKRMKDAGVRKVSYSSDAWHQKYVPFSSLGTAMRSTREAGMENELSVMETRSSGNWKRAKEMIPEELAGAKAFVHPALPAGRACEAMGEADTMKLFSPDRMGCIFDGMAALGFDGYYYLCCSMYYRTIPRLRIMHMSEGSFAQLEERILADDYLYLMLREGFGWYIRKMREMGMEIPEKVPFACVCCDRIFHHREFTDAIREEVRQRAEIMRKGGGAE